MTIQDEEKWWLAFCLIIVSILMIVAVIYFANTNIKVIHNIRQECSYLCEKNNLIFDDTYLSNQCYSNSDIREYYQFKKDYDNKCYLEKLK